MIDIPAGMVLCLMAIVIAIMVAAILPIWVYTHPSKLEYRVDAKRRLERAEVAAHKEDDERVLAGSAGPR